MHKNKNKHMAEEMLAKDTTAQMDDFDFDITRTFTVLTATLIIPVYLGLSVATFSIAGLS